MQPQVGSNIKVVTHNFTPVSPVLFPNEPNTLSYEGTVLKSEVHDNAYTFRMTGDTNCPIRVVELKDVVIINGTEFSIGDVPKDKIVIVKGSKGDEYVVTLGATGNNKCTCAGFGFRKTCGHIKKVLEAS
jgi:hypothetical protein